MECLIFHEIEECVSYGQPRLLWDQKGQSFIRILLRKPAFQCARILLKEGRKQVYIARFSSLNEIDEKLLREIIHEALLVDDLHIQKKKYKKI